MLWSDIGTARRSEPSKLKDRGKGGGGGRKRQRKTLVCYFGHFWGGKFPFQWQIAFLCNNKESQ